MNVTKDNEERLKKLIEKLERMKKSPLTPREYEYVIASLCMGATPNMFLEAMDRTYVARMKMDFMYASKIIESWISKGCLNLEDVKKLDEEMKAQRAKTQEQPSLEAEIESLKKEMAKMRNELNALQKAFINVMANSQGEK